MIQNKAAGKSICIDKVAYVHSKDEVHYYLLERSFQGWGYGDGFLGLARDNI